MLSHLLKIYWDLYLKIDIIDKIYPLNSYISTNIQFQVSKLSNIIVYPHLKFTLPSHNAPNPLPIFQLNLQPPKFIRQDFITIPTIILHSSLCSHRQTIVTSAERKKERNATNIRAHPPNICLANKLETKTWGEWLVEETDKDDRSPRYRASHAPLAAIFHPDCRPITLPIRDFDLNDVDSRASFFYSNSKRINWNSRVKMRKKMEWSWIFRGQDSWTRQRFCFNEVLGKLGWHDVKL